MRIPLLTLNMDWVFWSQWNSASDLTTWNSYFIRSQLWGSLTCEMVDIFGKCFRFRPYKCNNKMNTQLNDQIDSMVCLPQETCVDLQRLLSVHHSKHFNYSKSETIPPNLCGIIVGCNDWYFMDAWATSISLQIRNDTNLLSYNDDSRFL